MPRRRPPYTRPMDDDRVHRRRQHGRRHRRRPGRRRPGARARSSSSTRARRSAQGWPSASACGRSPPPTRRSPRRRSSSGRSSRSSSAPPPRLARRTSSEALQLSVMAGIRSDAIAEATRQRARGPGDAEHAGADRPGHRRRVRARRRCRPTSAQRVAAVLAPTGQLVWVDRRGGARCGHRAVGLGPGLRVPSARGDARRPAARWASAPTQARAARAADRRRRRGARRRLERQPSRRCASNVTSPGGTTHAAMTLARSARRQGRARRGDPRGARARPRARRRVRRDRPRVAVAMRARRPRLRRCKVTARRREG